MTQENVFVEKARVLINLNRYQDAANEIKKGLQSFPYSTSLCCEMSRVLYCLDQYEEATKFAKSTLNLDPQYAHAYYLLAFIYSRKKKYKLAFEMIEKALYYEPENTLYLVKKGWILYSTEKIQQAMDVCMKVLQQDSNHQGALRLAAYIHTYEKAYQKAEQYYCKLLKLDPENPDIMSDLGDCLEKQNKTIEAFNIYYQAAITNPVDRELRYNIYRVMNKVIGFMPTLDVKNKIEKQNQDIVKVIAKYQEQITLLEHHNKPEEFSKKILKVIKYVIVFFCIYSIVCLIFYLLFIHE